MLFLTQNLVKRYRVQTHSNVWQKETCDDIGRQAYLLLLDFDCLRIPDKTIRMVKIFYEDFECAVEDQGEICSWFSIKTGVKQTRVQYVRFSIL